MGYLPNNGNLIDSTLLIENQLRNHYYNHHYDNYHKCYHDKSISTACAKVESGYKTLAKHQLCDNKSTQIPLKTSVFLSG